MSFFFFMLTSPRLHYPPSFPLIAATSTQQRAGYFSFFFSPSDPGLPSDRPPLLFFAGEKATKGARRLLLFPSRRTTAELLSGGKALNKLGSPPPPFSSLLQQLLLAFAEPFFFPLSLQKRKPHPPPLGHHDNNGSTLPPPFSTRSLRVATLADIPPPFPSFFFFSFVFPPTPRWPHQFADLFPPSRDGIEKITLYPPLFFPRKWETRFCPFFIDDQLQPNSFPQNHCRRSPRAVIKLFFFFFLRRMWGLSGFFSPALEIRHPPHIFFLKCPPPPPPKPSVVISMPFPGKTLRLNLCTGATWSLLFSPPRNIGGLPVSLCQILKEKKITDSRRPNDFSNPFLFFFQYFRGLRLSYLFFFSSLDTFWSGHSPAPPFPFP